MQPKTKEIESVCRELQGTRVFGFLCDPKESNCSFQLLLELETSSGLSLMFTLRNHGCSFALQKGNEMILCSDLEEQEVKESAQKMLHELRNQDLLAIQFDPEMNPKPKIQFKFDQDFQLHLCCDTSQKSTRYWDLLLPDGSELKPF